MLWMCDVIVVPTNQYASTLNMCTLVCIFTTIPFSEPQHEAVTQVPWLHKTDVFVNIEVMLSHPAWEANRFSTNHERSSFSPLVNSNIVNNGKLIMKNYNKVVHSNIF